MRLTYTSVMRQEQKERLTYRSLYSTVNRKIFGVKEFSSYSSEIFSMSTHFHMSADTLASLQWLHSIAMVPSRLASFPRSRAQEPGNEASAHPEYFPVKFPAFFDRSAQRVLAKFPNLQ